MKLSGGKFKMSLSDILNEIESAIGRRLNQAEVLIIVKILEVIDENLSA